jgi:hypothetical protein
MNTPNFGSGKLGDGSIVCSSCFGKINKINPKIAFKLKNHSLNDIQNLLQDKSIIDEQKNSRLEEIKKQIQELKLNGVSNYLSRREINELPAILAPTEYVDNLAQGIYNSGQGILVSTNRRLLFVDKGMLYGLKVEDFPLDKITSIQYETGLLFGEIKIHTSGNIAKIDHVEKASARSFAEFVRNKLSQPKETVVVSKVVSEQTVLDQLERLAKFKESGILSEEEFQEQKKKLLEKL